MYNPAPLQPYVLSMRSHKTSIRFPVGTTKINSYEVPVVDFTVVISFVVDSGVVVRTVVTSSVVDGCAVVEI